MTFCKVQWSLPSLCTVSLQVTRPQAFCSRFGRRFKSSFFRSESARGRPSWQEPLAFGALGRCAMRPFVIFHWVLFHFRWVQGGLRWKSREAFAIEVPWWICRDIRSTRRFLSRFTFRRKWHKKTTIKDMNEKWNLTLRFWKLSTDCC